MASNLLFNIAWTHVTTRVRQTLVGMAGVAMGVGFTIMMAGLMQGSQIDFLRQLVDTMPHITMQDERRTAPPQPADQEYGAVQMSNVANVNNRPGIRYPESVMASLRSWMPATGSNTSSSTRRARAVSFAGRSTPCPLRRAGSRSRIAISLRFSGVARMSALSGYPV